MRQNEKERERERDVENEGGATRVDASRRDSTRERHWGGEATVAPSGEGLVEVKRAGGKRKWEREVTETKDTRQKLREASAWE